MTSALLSSAILAVIRSLVAEGELVAPDDMDPQVRRSPTNHFSPVALRLANGSGRPAKELATLIAGRLEQEPGIDRVDITGPGFLSMVSNDTGTPHTEEWDEAPAPIGTASWPDRPRTFDNPGFRVRYAYSRAACTQRYANDLGIEPAPAPLDDPREHRLLALLDDLPSRIRTVHPTNRMSARRKPASESLETVLGSVADAYHDVHEHCPALPKGDEPALPAHAARLMLARAVRDALGHGLRLLGEIPKERI